MRQHSLKVTYLIHKTLVEDTEVKKLIEENHIWPIVVPENLTYPYMTIKRNSIQNMVGNKDFAGDTVNFTLSVYSDDYDDSVSIGDAARLAIENHILQDDSIRLENITIISASEDWVGNAYAQTMSFKAEVYKPRQL